MNYVYDTTDCKVFSEALDFAWSMYLRGGRLNRQNVDTAQGALTYAILNAACEGERNPRRLALAAVNRSDAFLHRVQQQRSWAVPSNAA